MMKTNTARLISAICALLMLVAMTACGVKANPNSETDLTDSGSSTATEESLQEDPDDTGNTDITGDGETANSSANGGMTTKNGKTTTTKKGDTAQGSGTTTKGGTGAKRLEDGLDFGGKTFTKTIVGATPAVTTRRVAAFEKAYNCTLKLERLEWEKYNNQVAQSVASGKPYDICSIEGYFYPEGVTSLNMYEPLDKYFTNADVYGHQDNPTNVGVDLNLSEYFRINGKLYGVATHGVSVNATSSIYPLVLFYNKFAMKDFGYTGKNDPLQKYIGGTWTWSEFEKMCETIMQLSEGKYVAGNDFITQGQHIAFSNNVKITGKSGNKVVGNLNDSSFITALNTATKWFSGSVKFINPAASGLETFVAGNQYMFCKNAADGPLGLMQQVERSNAFGKNIANLGVVPFPTGPNNTNKAATVTNFAGKTAALGSKDPRVAIVYAKFQDYFNELDPLSKSNKYQYSAEVTAVFNKLSDNVVFPLPNYRTSGNSAAAIVNNIIDTARNGGDFTKMINDNKNAFQDCIDTALKQK